MRRVENNEIVTSPLSLAATSSARRSPLSSSFPQREKVAVFFFPLCRCCRTYQQPVGARWVSLMVPLRGGRAASLQGRPMTLRANAMRGAFLAPPGAARLPTATAYAQLRRRPFAAPGAPGGVPRCRPPPLRRPAVTPACRPPRFAPPCFADAHAPPVCSLHPLSHRTVAWLAPVAPTVAQWRLHRGGRAARMDRLATAVIGGLVTLLLPSPLGRYVGGGTRLGMGGGPRRGRVAGGGRPAVAKLPWTVVPLASVLLGRLALPSGGGRSN